MGRCWERVIRCVIGALCLRSLAEKHDHVSPVAGAVTKVIFAATRITDARNAVMRGLCLRFQCQ